MRRRCARRQVALLAVMLSPLSLRADRRQLRAATVLAPARRRRRSSTRSASRAAGGAPATAASSTARAGRRGARGGGRRGDVQRHASPARVRRRAPRRRRAGDLRQPVGSTRCAAATWSPPAVSSGTPPARSTSASATASEYVDPAPFIGRLVGRRPTRAGRRQRRPPRRHRRACVCGTTASVGSAGRTACPGIAWLIGCRHGSPGASFDAQSYPRHIHLLVAVASAPWAGSATARGDPMAVISMRQMLEAGVHFGHQTRRWNPKMKRFIFGERNGIYIIDLEQTLSRVEVAYNFIRELAAKGGTVLFVGTKKQAQDPVQSYAEKVGMPYVNERWLGGMLTNFETISKRVGKMLEYERMKASGEFDAMIKKEALMLDRELEQVAAQPRRSARHEAAPRRGLRDRHQEGAHRRHRGQQARHPGRGGRRHQRRPRRRAVPDPGQRRRDPRQLAAHPRHCRSRRGGSLHRRQAQPDPGARRNAAPKRTPRSRRPRPTPATPPPRPRPSATRGCGRPSRTRPTTTPTTMTAPRSPPRRPMPK